VSGRVGAQGRPPAQGTLRTPARADTPLTLLSGLLLCAPQEGGLGEASKAKPHVCFPSLLSVAAHTLGQAQRKAV